MGGGAKKNHTTKHGRREHRASRQRGNRKEQTVQKRGHRRRAKKATTAGDQVGNRHEYRGKRGWGQEEGPPTGPEGNKPPKQKGAG